MPAEALGPVAGGFTAAADATGKPDELDIPPPETAAGAVDRTDPCPVPV